MKKFLPFLAVIVVAGVAGYLSYSNKTKSPNTQNTQVSTPGATATKAPGDTTASTLSTTQTLPEDTSGDDIELSEDDGTEEIHDRPAAEAYKNLDEALNAIKNGAVDYNDIVLEQFTMPGEDCKFCPALYEQLRSMVITPELTNDQRSYYSELLAISGRLDNIKSLVEAIKTAPNAEQADLFAEALELSTGKTDVVSYLGEQLSSDNQVLKEAGVAALTNQGSRQAVDLLYKNTVQGGDSDGYYSLGIGLGELVPEPEAMPLLQELAQKRDGYSHLAVKSLLNGGLDGVKIVFDVLSNSKDTEFDKQMLKNAIDHVSYEEPVEEFLKQAAQSPKPNVAEFAKQILADFKPDEEEAASAPPAIPPTSATAQ